MSTRPQRMAALSLPLAAAALLACNGARAPESASGSTAASAATAGAQATPASGRLLVSLAATPNPLLASIHVTIAAVRAHSAEAGWMDLGLAAPASLDLLALLDGQVGLAVTQVPPGTVTQLRLVLDPDANSMLDLDGASYPLDVPSGIESGIKIMGPWSISPCGDTDVALEFDGVESLRYHPTGQTGDRERWILRPVIRTKGVQLQPGSCEQPGDGAACTGSDCPQPPGGANCAGGTCPPAGAGSPCLDGSECLSGLCTERVCGQGGPGVPCRAAADCVSAACGPAGLCGPGTAGGAGAGCQAATDCLSSSCTAGQCDPGLQGSSCAVAADCAGGLSCLGGSCFAPAQ